MATKRAAPDINAISSPKRPKLDSATQDQSEDANDNSAVDDEVQQIFEEYHEQIVPNLQNPQLSVQLPASQVHDGGFYSLLSNSARDYAIPRLRADHEARPLLLIPTHDGPVEVWVDMASPVLHAAEEFLLALGLLVTRRPPVVVYRVNTFTVYSMIYAGRSEAYILEHLEALSKCLPDPAVASLIRSVVASYAQLKLVIRQNKYFIESDSQDAVDVLLADPRVKVALKNEHAVAGGSSPQFSFSIGDDQLQVVQKRAIELGYPLLEQYDYANDSANPSLKIQLKPETQIRPHQEIALSKVFHDGRGHSGIIVLPCGAGKTLVGVAAACRVQKSCLIFCTSMLAVNQWKDQLLRFTNVDEKKIVLFTSDSKGKASVPKDACIVISTYSMIAKPDKDRATAALKLMQKLREREWPLVVLDEAHVVPADTCKKAIGSFKAHLKIGLTATLVREDDKIDDLHFIVGPKLHDEFWKPLAEKGYIADSECAVVHCPMMPAFATAYETARHTKRQLLSAMDPNKFAVCYSLITHLESVGHKIIVMSDNLYALENYAIQMNRPFIHGDVLGIEQNDLLDAFRADKYNTIFLSKIGDVALDLPEATVLIQISSHFASRRQEAQRMGRILRARRRSEEGFRVKFITIVSTATTEMSDSTHRQQFLIDQGYDYDVLTPDTLPCPLRAIRVGKFAPENERELLAELMQVDTAPALPSNTNKIQKKPARKSNVGRNKLFVDRDRQTTKARKAREQGVQAAAGSSRL
ncbi:DNA repair helicase RAD25 [Auriculariales sp. MPI-PUGE-AT-0066]|nr:DNA repair helicase RAD25 [Auriculariales sp. MPI-PUGE-AT-0066]